MEREQRDIEQTRAIHAAWLASRPLVGVPDVVHLQAIAEAEAARASEARLLEELRAELEAERQAPTPLREKS
jgi:hypothetical protein